MSVRKEAAAEAVFDPIGPDPLAERVAAQIEDHILNSVLKEGARLPAERELAAELAVSRPKVREGLQLLEERGLVRIVAGEGAFIAALSGPAMTPALIELFTRHPSALDDHLEFRRHQEIFAARLAAERATAADHVRLEGIVDAMRAAQAEGEQTQIAALDSDFHTAIAEASFNRTLIHTLAALYELNRRAVFFSRTEMLTSPTVGAELLRQHADIAAAIVSGEAETAARLSAEHIDYVRGALKDALAQKNRLIVSQKRGAASKPAE